MIQKYKVALRLLLVCIKYISIQRFKVIRLSSEFDRRFFLSHKYGQDSN